MAVSFTYGLIGEALAHSYSQLIHRDYFKTDYRLIEVAPAEVDALLQGGDFCGLNVTIPYKEAVLPFCRLSELAGRIASVNTIVNRAGILHGFNTDYGGLVYLAGRIGIDFRDRKVLILGSGGTSKTAVCVATDAGAAQVVVVSRRGSDNYENIARHGDADIIINTTPVGMYPHLGASPVGLEDFERLAGVLDVIYNPRETLLVQNALSRGIPAGGGLPMLVAQAFYAHKLFFSDYVIETISPGIMDRSVIEDIQETVNFGESGE